MIRALYTAASGMSAQQTNLDTVANNLANSATTGFHQRQVQFEDMIYQNLITPGSAQTQQTLSAGLQVGLGTKSAASEVIMTQGDFNQTNAAQLGPIQLATFANPGGLNSVGSNLLEQTASSGNPITDTPGGTSGMGTL